MVGRTCSVRSDARTTAQRRAGGGGHPTVGLRSFNLDLIYGAAGETLDDWRRDGGAIALDPPHVSAYALTIEAGHAARRRSRPASRRRRPGRQVRARRPRAHGAGLENYEISNWARPGHECRHNLLYWRQQDYSGFGCAAHSHRGGRRWWNVRTPDRYIELVSRLLPVEAAGETLDDETRRIEGLQLALRMRDGVPADTLDGEASRPGRTARRPVGADPLAAGCSPTSPPSLSPSAPHWEVRRAASGGGKGANSSGKTLPTLASQVVAVAPARPDAGVRPSGARRSSAGGDPSSGSGRTSASHDGSKKNGNDSRSRPLRLRTRCGVER